MIKNTVNKPNANRSRPLFKYRVPNANNAHPKSPSHFTDTLGNISLSSKWVKEIKAAVNQNITSRPMVILDLQKVEEIDFVKSKFEWGVFVKAYIPAQGLGFSESFGFYLDYLLMLLSYPIVA